MYLTTILYYCTILAYLYTSLDCTTANVPHYAYYGDAYKYLILTYLTTIYYYTSV